MLEQQRLAFAAKKKKMQDKYQDPKEMQNFIAEKISSMKTLIQKLLDEKPSKQNLLIINQQFQQLDDYYINTSYAMHPYDAKQYKEVIFQNSNYKFQQQINEVQNKIRIYKRKLKPKKKFRFKSKFKKKSEQKKKEKVEKVQKVEKVEEVDNSDLSFIQGLVNLEKETRILTQKDFTHIFKLEKLKDCTIELQGNLQTAYLLDIENCKISFGGIKTSVYITNCNNSEVQVMAQQIRIHKSNNNHFKTFCSGDTIIEDCTDLIFSNYDYIYENQQEDIKSIGFDQKTNNWKNVKDFKWLKQEQSPNFKIQQ